MVPFSSARGQRVDVYYRVRKIGQLIQEILVQLLSDVVSFFHRKMGIDPDVYLRVEPVSQPSYPHMANFTNSFSVADNTPKANHRGREVTAFPKLRMVSATRAILPEKNTTTTWSKAVIIKHTKDYLTAQIPLLVEIIEGSTTWPW